MAIDYNKLKNWHFPDIEHSYTAKDTMLYALGLGAGSDPMDASELPFVYEEGLKALPSMAVILAYPGFWLRDPETGVDWMRLLHGEQGLIMHKPIPPSGTVIGKLRNIDIIDKGAGKGALLFSERTIFDKASGDLLCTLTSTTFLRGDGGFGGPTGPVPQPHTLPERTPDLHVDLKTLPQAALIYRLSGDYNPLHADPKVAAVGGFPARSCMACAPMA